MPSNYSTNLGLELMVTGEKSDTWGDITNTNLGTLLEQAVSGYVTQAVATGTDTTITIPDGSTGVARNMYIELTGTGGAATNLIVPAKKKLYFIYNNTASGQVTVKVSGQTGVSVANGTKVILVCDGTDVELATSYPTLPVAVADGGTGQTSYTNGQLLIGNSTGNTLTKATLTAGSNISITNGAGSITIAATNPIQGPGSSTDTAVVLWDGTGGNQIKNSVVTVNSSGKITTAGDALINNVYIGRKYAGTGGGPDQNLVVGQNAGANLFSLGTQNLNTILGNEAGNGLTGASSTGNFNTMVGYGAGGNGANTSSNTFIGYLSGYNIGSTGNVAVGHAAMQGGGGNSAVSNVGVGFQALLSITTGGQNVAIGNASGDAISTGYWNTCLGSIAGSNINVGSANTLVGFTSGSGITSGSTNSALGDSAYLSGNYNNSTCLGYNAQVDASNQVQLGDSNTTTYVYGSVANRASDIRDKADVQDTNLGMNFIMQLRPRMYRWDYREDYRTKPPVRPNAAEYEGREEQYAADFAQWNTDYANWQEANKIGNLTHDGTHKRNRFHQGLIAQEVKQTMDAMGVDFGGYQDFKVKGGDDRLTLVYEELIPPLIKAIQELKAEFDEYKRTHP